MLSRFGGCHLFFPPFLPQYVIDPTLQPKSIQMTVSVGMKGQVDRYAGIYKLDGDRLVIAFRKNGPAPETFESKPGSGVTLLTLGK